jgi:hypothetical protein
MRSLLILIAVVSVGMFLAAPSFANDAGSHCVQFGDDHPGCGGGGGDDDDDDDNGGNGHNGGSTNSAFSASGSIAGAGVFDSGNSASTSSVGDTSAFSGVDFENARLGNSHNANRLSTDTDNDQSTDVSIDASDRSTTIVEDRKDPVASSAPVFASACSAGISAQSYGFGGALANTNPMCDLALAVELAIKVENFDLARKLVDRAARFAWHRTNPMRMWGQWIPFIGQLI